MEFPKSYFEDEVRDGFYVPAMMKRAWAAQIEVLEDIDKVCRKYNIHYWADWGTLIGTIRHGGFIPWDDDMDIGMLRKDYDIFNKVAPDELPKGYGLLNFERFHTGNYDNHLTRVHNGGKIRVDKEFLTKFHGFPYVAGMDVFPLDFIPPTEKEEEMLIEQVKTLAAVAGMVSTDKQEEAEEYLDKIEEIYDIKFDRSKPLMPQIFQCLENLCRECTGEESEYITHIAERTKCDYKEPIKYYAETISLPYEGRMIDVPAAYDGAMMRKTRGYMQPLREKDGHEYPFYEKQFRDIDKKMSLLKKYVFSESDLTREESKGENEGAWTGLKPYAKEMLQLFGIVRENVVRAVRQGNPDFAMGLLEDCQEGAIALGNRIEELKGSGYVTVGILEQFCEVLYTIHEMIAENGDADAADKMFEEILTRLSDSVQKDIIERKVVVFLPYKASLWDSLESIWRAAVSDPSCDVYVVPIPYCEKEFNGALGDIRYEGEQFPDEVPVTGYEAFDLTLQHPDMIFIHNPYDGYNLATTVPPMFYAKELRKCTDKLVYIPWFVVDEIEEDDMRGNVSMDYFCTMPGVVCADRVVVQSEQMREAYIRKLSEFAGEDTRAVWEEKILGLGSPTYDKERERKNAIKVPEEWREVFLKNDGSHRTVILYNTVPEAMLEHDAAMLDKIRNTLAVFEGQKEEIALVWCANLSRSDYVKEMRPKLWKKYRQLVKEYHEAGWGILSDLSKDDEWEAIQKFGCGYYGDPDSSVRLCRRSGMAALIQNARILYDRQNSGDMLLSNASGGSFSGNEAVYRELEEEVIRESADRTLMQMEQFLINRKQGTQGEESQKTVGKTIFEALKA